MKDVFVSLPTGIRSCTFCLDYVDSMCSCRQSEESHTLLIALIKKQKSNEEHHDTDMKTFRDDPMQHVFASRETRETMLSHKGRS